MRIALVVALTATVAGCVSSPVQYGASLSPQDPKWATPECQQARTDAMNYDAREKGQPGWGFGVLLGPYSMGLVAAAADVAPAYLYLMASDFMTGETIHIDGGQRLV